MAEKSKKTHKYKKAHFEHHKDGSSTAHYEHDEGPEKDSKHAVASLDHLHDSVEDHLGGEPNDEEAALDRGEHGIPEEHAAPVGIAMPSPMPGQGV